MAKIAVITPTSLAFAHMGQNSARAPSGWGLWAELPKRKTWYTQKFNGTLLIYHFNPEKRRKKRKKPFPFSHKTDCRWVTLPRITLTPSLWKRSVTLYQVMPSDLMAPGAEEPMCTITWTLQPNVLWPAGLEMMKSIDFCVPQEITTLGCRLKKFEVSYNQRCFFYSITEYFRLFLVSLMAPSELCKVGLIVSTAPGFACGEYMTFPLQF